MTSRPRRTKKVQGTEGLRDKKPQQKKKQKSIKKYKGKRESMYCVFFVVCRHHLRNEGRLLDGKIQ